MQRTATAVWNGSLKEGSGNISTQSKTLSSTPYSFRMRFEEEPGTNPEELVAAAHAGCFSMALSATLGGKEIVPESLTTTCTVTLDFIDGKPTVTKSHLSLMAKVPGVDADIFHAAAAEAKAGCPISRLLNAEISLDVTLEN